MGVCAGGRSANCFFDDNKPLLGDRGCSRGMRIAIFFFLILSGGARSRCSLRNEGVWGPLQWVRDTKGAYPFQEKKAGGVGCVLPLISRKYSFGITSR